MSRQLLVCLVGTEDEDDEHRVCKIDVCIGWGGEEGRILLSKQFKVDTEECFNNMLTCIQEKVDKEREHVSDLYVEIVVENVEDLVDWTHQFRLPISKWPLSKSYENKETQLCPLDIIENEMYHLLDGKPKDTICYIDQFGFGYAKELFEKKEIYRALTVRLKKTKLINFSCPSE